MHLIDRFAIPWAWPRYWSIDFGYTNPFVCQFSAQDPDGRLYRYREIYRSKRLVEDHAQMIKRLWNEELQACCRMPSGQPEARIRSALRPRAIVCDHDAEDRATLAKHLGLATTPARKRPG